MQKLDLRNHLRLLTKNLASEELTGLVEQKIALEAKKLLPVVIKSKTGFDKATLNPEQEVILKQFKAYDFFEAEYFSTLVAFISSFGNQSTDNYLQNLSFSRFYSFHKSLLITSNLIDDALISNRELFDKSGDFDSNNLPSWGILMLQVVDDENPSIKKFNIIINSLEKLLEIIYMLLEKIDGIKLDEQPRIILIDSGSDINITLKLPEEPTKTVVTLIKEFWDLIVNGKYARHKKNIEVIEDSISVLKKIKEAEPTIGRECAEIWRQGIIENTEKILLNNTLTKAIVSTQEEVSSRKLLLQQSRMFQLTEGNKNENNDVE